MQRIGKKLKKSAFTVKIKLIIKEVFWIPWISKHLNQVKTQYQKFGP